MKIKLEIIDGKIIILINDLPHVVLKQNELVGIQAWMEGEKHPSYWIEYSMRDGAEVTCSYNKFEKWKEILKLITDADLFECL